MTSLFSKLILGILFITIVPFTSSVYAKPSHVQCSDSPKDGIRSLTYETIWERSAESEDYLISFMIDASYGPSGNICVVDYQQKNLLIFDPMGNWLRTFGGEGQGPGELRDARKLFLVGGRFGLLQSFPAAIVWLNSDGSPGGKVSIAGDDSNDMVFPTVGHAMQAGSNIYAWVTQLSYSESGDDAESWIVKVENDGSVGPILYSPPEMPNVREGNGINEGKAYDIWHRRWISDGKGGVWVAPERDGYVLQHWNEKGELELEVSRNYEPVARNENGNDRIRRWFTKRGWAPSQIDVGETAPVVQSLRLGDNGDVWVRLDQGGKSSHSDLLAVYDVISQTGQYLEQVRFHSSLDINGRQMLNDMTALVLATDPDDEEQIITLQKAVDTKGSN